MLEKEINSMLYSTPTLLLKYLHYYWVAANAKGHGIHSPFVFKFIQEILNSKSSLEQIENSAPVVNKILQEIEAASSSKLHPKIKLVIARLLQSNHPVSFSVTGDMKPFDADSAINTNAKIGLTESVESIDFAFIGNGQNKETMLQSASRLIDKMHSNSWVILHGLHADSKMEAAWGQLKKHANIRLTIDLFSIGILFCRKEQKEQEHFIIRY
jgi:hypothetical protein